MTKINKKKVLFLSIFDYAGSGHRYSESVNKFGKYESTSLKIYPHQYGYETDFCVLGNGKNMDYDNIKKRIIKAQKLINDADILHFKGDNPILKTWGLVERQNNKYFLNRTCPNFIIPLEKPIVITTSGSLFRKHLKRSEFCQAKFPIEMMKNNTNARTVTTPDLNYPEFDSEWLPFPIEMKKDNNFWHENNKKEGIITIGHSPSKRSKKGTNDVLIPAFNKAKKHFVSKGIKLELDIIENVLYQECLERKKKLTIFWDQCGFGFYGNSLVEACSFGVPSMAWISDHSLGQMDESDRDKLVVRNFIQGDVNSCCHSIIEMIESDMYKMSTKTKEWAWNTHSYESVGKRISKIYDRIKY